MTLVWSSQRKSRPGTLAGPDGEERQVGVPTAGTEVAAGGESGRGRAIDGVLFRAIQSSSRRFNPLKPGCVHSMERL